MNVEHALDQMVTQRRCFIGLRNTGRCDVCKRDDAEWIFTSIVDLSSECEKCFIERAKKALTKPKLNLEDFAKV